MRKKSRFALARLRSRITSRRKKKNESLLEQIEKSSTLSTDDQLFFGFVFTLLVFLVPLPEFDLSSIFTEIGIEVVPSSGFITAKWVLISFLLFSSVARYLTTFTNRDKTKNNLRIISVSFLLGCPYFIIADWTVRPLSTVLTKIDPYLLFLSPFVLIMASIVIGQFVERRWNKIYGQEKAPTSLAFSYVGLSIAVTYYVALTIAIFVPLSYFDNVIIMTGSFVFTFLLWKYLPSHDEITTKLKKFSIIWKNHLRLKQ